ACKTTSSGIANMIPIEIRNGVKILRAQGQSLREISRLLKLSRNAVRRILREKNGARAASPPCDAATLARLEEAFRRARGNGVRVRQPGQRVRHTGRPAPAPPPACCLASYLPPS